MTTTPREALIEALRTFLTYPSKTRASEVVDALDAHVTKLIDAALDDYANAARESSRHREAAEAVLEEREAKEAPSVVCGVMFYDGDICHAPTPCRLHDRHVDPNDIRAPAPVGGTEARAGTRVVPLCVHDIMASQCADPACKVTAWLRQYAGASYGLMVVEGSREASQKFHDEMAAIEAEVVAALRSRSTGAVPEESKP
ncbi:MAG: hypothetical protein ABL993_02440 [Vicinamibacterales bacterium]